MGQEHLWLAQRAGLVVGLVGLIVGPCPSEAHVEPIIVSMRERRKGIGRALLKRVIEESTALGVRFLTVKPIARNAQAMSFFYDEGFRILGGVEMCIEVNPSESSTCQAGRELFGCRFEY